MTMSKKIISFLGLSAGALFMLWYGNYQYGTGDQIIHIPYIKYLINPQLYHQDSLIDLLKEKPSLFWNLVLPVFKIVNIEYGLLFLQILSAIVFLWSIQLFTYTITKNKLAGWLAVILSLIPHYSFGFSSLFNASGFIPRNFTIGLIILALILYIKKKKILAYFSMGLLATLHIISVIPIVISCFVVDIYTAITNKDLDTLDSGKKIAKYFLAFIIGCIPLLALYGGFANNNATKQVSAIDYTVYFKSILTPFYTNSTFPESLRLVDAALIVAACLYTLTYGNIKLALPKRKLLVAISLISTLLVGLSIVVENWVQIPLLMQLQQGRSGQYTVLVFTTLLAWQIAVIFKKSQNYFKLANLMFLSTVMPLFSLMLPLTLAIKKKSPTVFTQLVKLNIVISLILFNYHFLSYLKYIKPSVNTGIQLSDNTRAQLWLKNNSKPQDKILAPFYIGGFTEPDFRTVSERPVILTNGELVETILNTSHIPDTKSKLDDLTGNHYNYLTHEDRLFDYYIERKLYHQNIQSKLSYLKQKYQISYVVIESDYSLNSNKLVYSNDRYKIYQL